MDERFAQPHHHNYQPGPLLFGHGSVSLSSFNLTEWVSRNCTASQVFEYSRRRKTSAGYAVRAFGVAPPIISSILVTELFTLSRIMPSSAFSSRVIQQYSSVMPLGSLK